MNYIIKLQALYRGHSARKLFHFLKNAKRVFLYKTKLSRLIQNTSRWMNLGKQYQIKSTIQMENVKSGPYILSKQVQPTKDNGSVASVMVLGSRSGRMAHAMRGSGVTIELMEMESSCTSTATSMKALGSTTKQMVSGHTFMSTVRDMRGSGKMIYSTGMARRPGLMAPYTKDNTRQGRNMDGVCTLGTTAHAMKVNGTRTKFAESEHTLG